MKKIAIIGASYLQQPLIEKAKEMGIETHVFAWECGDIGEKTADYFYPISITEKEQILKKCIDIGIHGICTIASDLATVAVGYVANHMGLIGNTEECVYLSTNKHAMRKAFEEHGDPSPKSIFVKAPDDLVGERLQYPVIVKPIDRSGSRGITKLYSEDGLKDAIEYASNQGFEKCALVEEFAKGQEYSVEYISYQGKHQFLACTKKYTTGAPHFIETGHLQPAPISEQQLKRIKLVVSHALDSLMVTYGASHSEIKIDDEGNIKIIEIGARMGGDFIGSHLVQLSTGIDFVKAVIQIALGEEPDIFLKKNVNGAAVRFVFTEKDLTVYNQLMKEHPEYLVFCDFEKPQGREVTDSSTRYGAYLIKASYTEELERYMPE